MTTTNNNVNNNNVNNANNVTANLMLGLCGMQNIPQVINALNNAGKQCSNVYDVYVAKDEVSLQQLLQRKFTPRSVVFLNNRGTNKNGEHKGYVLVHLKARLRRLNVFSGLQLLVKVLCKQAIATALAETNKYIQILGYKPKLQLFQALNQCFSVGIVDHTGFVDATKFAINHDADRFGKLCGSLYKYEYSNVMGVSFSHKLTGLIANPKSNKTDYIATLKQTAIGLARCFNINVDASENLIDVDNLCFDVESDKEISEKLKEQFVSID